MAGLDYRRFDDDRLLRGPRHGRRCQPAAAKAALERYGDRQPGPLCYLACRCCARSKRLRAAGSTASSPLLKVFIPIGISFYTFEAINYTVDVFRRRVPAEKNLANFMLFITFFPHLVAGPIVRAVISCRKFVGISTGIGRAFNLAFSSS